MGQFSVTIYGATGSVLNDIQQSWACFLIQNPALNGNVLSLKSMRGEIRPLGRALVSVRTSDARPPGSLTKVLMKNRNPPSLAPLG